MDELSSLPADPGEAIPTRLRILASAQNLGVLRSVHRPTSWLAKRRFPHGRIYLYDQGFVLGQADGSSLLLFRWEQITAKKSAGGYLIAAADGRALGLTRKWSDFAGLEQAITAGVQQPQ